MHYSGLVTCIVVLIALTNCSQFREPLLLQVSWRLQGPGALLAREPGCALMNPLLCRVSSRPERFPAAPPPPASTGPLLLPSPAGREFAAGRGAPRGAQHGEGDGSARPLARSALLPPWPDVSPAAVPGPGGDGASSEQPRLQRGARPRRLAPVLKLLYRAGLTRGKARCADKSLYIFSRALAPKCWLRVWQPQS